MAQHHGLFKQLKTVKIIADYQDSFSLSRQLQAVKTAADWQD